MKILITGGTGFIGSRLVERCLRNGHEVALLGQQNTPAEEHNLTAFRDRGVAITEGSVTDTEAVRTAASGCEVVFHLAAAQHEVNVPDEHFHAVNVEGTRNVLEVAAANGVKRFVHGSTIGVYGAAMAGEIDEASTVQPDNIYGKTKLAGEQLALSYVNRLPVTAIRISETYGPGDRRLLKLFKAIEKNVFFLIGDGENKHQLIYVEDLIDGLWLAATDGRGVGETFVLAGGEVLTTRQMVTTIAQAVGTKPRRLRAPMAPFVLAANIMEKTLRPLGIQPPLHPRRLDFFRKSFYFSQRKAREQLGFEAHTSFAAGVAATVRWYRDNGYMGSGRPPPLQHRVRITPPSAYDTRPRSSL